MLSNKSNPPDYNASKAEAEALSKQCRVYDEGRTIEQIKTFRPFGMRFKAGMTLISQYVVLGARDDASNGGEWKTNYPFMNNILYSHSAMS